MTTAFLFPGQGSQFAGMGQTLAQNFPSAREKFEQADDALGFAISRLCFEGPEEELKLTENQQPALLEVVIAGNKAAVERAMELAKAAGAKRVVALPVSAPFHCALMQPAQQRLRIDLDATRFGDLAMPLVNNWQARAIATGAEAREGLY